MKTTAHFLVFVKLFQEKSRRKIKFLLIEKVVNVNVNTVKLCLKKYNEGGVDLALYDKPRPGHPVEITDDAVAWIVDLACQRPADLGYSQELWTLKKPAPTYPGKCTGGGFSPACHNHKAHGPGDIAKVGDQTLQNQVLLRKMCP